MNNLFPKTPFDNLIHQSGNKTSWYFITLSIISITISLFISSGYTRYLIILVPLSIAIGIVPLFVKVGVTILYEWEGEIGEFLNKSQTEIETICNLRFEKFSKVHIPVIAGFVFTVFASIIYYQADSFGELPLAEKILSWSIFSASTFICGMGLISIIHLTLFFRDIGKFPVEVTGTAYGIMSSGNKLLSCFFLGCLAWCAYSFSGFGVVFYSINPFYYLSLPSFVFLVGSFFFAQYPLHIRMTEYKKKRIRRIQKLIESAFPKENEEVKKEQLELLSRLSDLSKEASKLPVWPCNFKTSIGVFSSALGAVSPLLSIGIKHFFS
jgi:hypothetical protein